MQRRNFRITNYALGCGTKNDKFTNNVAAIRLLKQIEDEERLATPDEQEILFPAMWAGAVLCCVSALMKKTAGMRAESAAYRRRICSRPEPAA